MVIGKCDPAVHPALGHMAGSPGQYTTSASRHRRAIVHVHRKSRSSGCPLFAPLFAPFSPARPVRILSDLHLALAHHIPRSWSTSSRTSLGLISTGYPEWSRTTSTWSAGVPDSIRHVPFFSDTDFVVPPSTRSYVPSARSTKWSRL